MWQQYNKIAAARDDIKLANDMIDIGNRFNFDEKLIDSKIRSKRDDSIPP